MPMPEGQPSGAAAGDARAPDVEVVSESEDISQSDAAVAKVPPVLQDTESMRSEVIQVEADDLEPVFQALNLEECHQLGVAAADGTDLEDPFDVLSGRDKDLADLSAALADSNTGDSKKLVVFLDGTANTKDSRTNIWRLYTYAVKAACEGKPVVPRYFRGVGTDRFNMIRGGVMGNGIDELIQSAYLHLAEVYRPGDQIFLFGFSRGAYAARALNGLIEFIGLPDTGGEPMRSSEMKALYRVYKKKNDGKSNFEARRRVAIIDETRDHAIHRGANKVVVDVIGVFDTVAALGVARDDFPDEYRTDLYAKEGYHAIAIDEQRNDFRVLRFDDRIKPDQSLEEVWFAGAHGNVGGSYDKGMELISLEWLVNRLDHHGIFEVMPGTLACDPAPCELAKFRDEFLDKDLFGKLGLHWRQPARGDVLHGSVLCRLHASLGDLIEPHCGREKFQRYQPQNLYEPVEGSYNFYPYNCHSGLKVEASMVGLEPSDNTLGSELECKPE
jgi:hypothetical protein